MELLQAISCCRRSSPRNAKTNLLGHSLSIDGESSERRKPQSGAPVSSLLALILWICFLPAGTAAQETPEQTLGLGELRAISLEKDRNLIMRVESEARCSFSDAEAISSELEHSYWIAKSSRAPDPGVDVYLTIEQVVVSGAQPIFKPLAKCLSCGELNPKIGGIYTLPQVDGPVLAGIFVCTVTAKEGEEPSCRGKEVAEWETLFRRYSVKLDSSTGKGKINLSRTPPSDKIYFFRYLLIDKDAVRFTEQSMTRESYDRLAALLPNTPGKTNAIALLRKYGGLASAPLKASGPGLTVNLPHYEPGKCGH